MKRYEVQIGTVKMGGDQPVRIQSMTNTDTADVESTVQQIKELADAGSEIVRITVNDQEAAKAVTAIREQLNMEGYEHIPLVGDFHYNGHLLLRRYPECAQALDKYRINPGNVGKGTQRAEHFSEIVRVAVEQQKPVRIGVNWGSLDEDLLSTLMDENQEKGSPLSDREVVREAMVQSALQSAALAEEIGLRADQIVLSVKMSEVPDMIQAYEELFRRSEDLGKPYALHLGLTEAGPGMKGIVASSAALSVLLRKGIGDTIRISLTPSPEGARSDEVQACKLLLQSLELRSFAPSVTSCPGCGRTSNDLYQVLAREVTSYIDQRMPDWSQLSEEVKSMKVAVMGCVVNGPGESKHADIGISLPGKSEEPMAIVYENGELITKLHGEKILEEFLELLEHYVQKKFA